MSFLISLFIASTGKVDRSLEIGASVTSEVKAFLTWLRTESDVPPNNRFTKAVCNHLLMMSLSSVNRDLHEYSLEIPR